MNSHSLTLMKQNTSFKIACGYFLLICLLLGSIYYIYHQTSSLARMSGNEQTLAERRKVTHQLVSQLYETENIGQAGHFGRWEAYRKYVQSMSNVQQTISALDTLFTDSLQKARLDTLSSLLTGKQENMKRLVLTLENNSAPQIYQHQISLLVKSQDTVIQKPHITRQIIQKDKSYTVKEPKKNFFQRLASAFHKPEADTTAVKQTVQILETDTIHQEFNARDTLAHILDSIESSMKQYNSRRRQRINAQAERLWYTSLELNNRVTQLLESIEKEEQQRLEEESRKAYMVRKQAALTTGLIATAAILLAIVFFVIVWRDITKSNHYRHELEKSKKRAEDLLVSREKLMLTVTHDIKAPVGSIMGYTELLVPYVRENRPKNYLDNIRSSSEHLLSLVGSLLDYHNGFAPSQLQSGRTLTHHSPKLLAHGGKKRIGTAIRDLSRNPTDLYRRCFPHPADYGQPVKQCPEIHTAGAYPPSRQNARPPALHHRTRYRMRNDCGRTTNDFQGIYPPEQCTRGRRGWFGTIHHAETCTTPSRRNPFGKYSRKRQFLLCHTPLATHPQKTGSCRRSPCHP